MEKIIVVNFKVIFYTFYIKKYKPECSAKTMKGGGSSGLCTILTSHALTVLPVFAFLDNLA